MRYKLCYLDGDIRDSSDNINFLIFHSKALSRWYIQTYVLDTQTNEKIFVGNL